MSECRRLAEAVADERPDVALAIAGYLIQYGRGFDAAGMPFALPTAYEDVSEQCEGAADPKHALDLAKVLADNLRAMRAAASPVAQKGALNSGLKLCLWAAAHAREDMLETLLGRVSTMPAEWSAALLDR